MTMTNTSPSTGFETTTPSLGMGALGKAVWKAAVSVTRSMQCSRMQDVLEQLSDRQLDDIGLQRADIREYSRWLVMGKGENRWQGSAASSATQINRD